jgi:UDP-N-acetylglucosamine 2-epimerase (non-hydrolysing)
MKVMTIVGTRPELIKLSRVIAELDRCFRHVLVHTGQNFDFELNEIFFQELGIRRPDHFLDAAGENPARTIGEVIARSYDLIAAEKPEAVLILGDTNSALAAISAKRLKVPIFHMEAGNRCFDERVPEEVNRRLVDHASDVNLPYTEHARRYLLAEGLPADRVIKTGSPMAEVLAYYGAAIGKHAVLQELGLETATYFLASAHREENVDDPERLAKLLAAFEAIARKYGQPVIVSVHPRTRKRIEESGRAAALDSRVRLLKPLGFLAYVKLQMNARCVLSDSGTLTEESSLLGFAAVTIRDAHERPEGMDEATLLMCGVNPDQVLAAVELAMHQREGGMHLFRTVADYEPGNVSKKVARIIASYTGYVNRVVWRKPS